MKDKERGTVRVGGASFTTMMDRRLIEMVKERRRLLCIGEDVRKDEDSAKA